jgi:DNA-binding winged helix-turn-helix (wHTH) protein/tetratricopeptide (TPR) repeat protein
MNRPSIIYEFGAFSLNVAERFLLREGRIVALKPKVLDLLLVLVQNSGRILEKDELMNQVWPDSFVEESNLTVSISALRKVLGKGKDGQAFIENISKRGYRFVAEVVILERSAHPLTTYTDGKHQADSNRTSIAVLPFKHIGLGEDEYLGFGITDALITRLSNVQQVIVRPTSAVRKFQDVLDPIAAGQELRVESVLDGSIRRSGQRIRVTVQMVSMANGASLWADKFDEQFTDIFEVEDSISEQVTKALMLRLTPEEKELLVKRHTEDNEAYQAYLRGRYFWNKRKPDDFKRAIECFQKAIEIDPDYALAYGGLADCYMTARVYSLLPQKESLIKGAEAALKAVQLDNTLAAAHVSLANQRFYLWNWSDAEREYKVAIALNPNYAEAHQWYSFFLRSMGRFDAALAEIRRALELDSLSLTIKLSLGITYYFAHQYDRAIEHLFAVLDLEPNYEIVHFFLGMAYVQKKMYDEAITEYKKAIKVVELDVQAYIGHAYAMSGRKAEAHQVLDELLERLQQRYVEPFFIALIYTALDEKDQAFAWLEKGYEEHLSTMGVLKIDPMFDSLRDDSRFESLLQRMGLADDLNGG